MKEPKVSPENICTPPPPLEIKDCLAKSFNENDQQKEVNITTHSLIVGKVAELLIQLFPQQLQNALFPDGSALVASSHDVGKICPTFQKKFMSPWEKVSPLDLNASNLNLNVIGDFMLE